MRIPSWTTEDALVKINGRPLEAIADSGSYLSIRRNWQDGDMTSIALTMKLRQGALPGDDSVAAALYGPLVQAADLGAGPPPDAPMRVVHSGDAVLRSLPPVVPLPKVAAGQDADTKQWIQIDSPSELRFTIASENSKSQLMPIYQISATPFTGSCKAPGLEHFRSHCLQ